MVVFLQKRIKAFLQKVVIPGRFQAGLGEEEDKSCCFCSFLLLLGLPPITLVADKSD